MPRVSLDVKGSWSFVRKPISTIRQDGDIGGCSDTLGTEGRGEPGRRKSAEALTARRPCRGHVLALAEAQLCDRS
jgi:hypothetical protein